MWLDVDHGSVQIDFSATVRRKRRLDECSLVGHTECALSLPDALSKSMLIPNFWKLMIIIIRNRVKRPRESLPELEWTQIFSLYSCVASMHLNVHWEDDA